METSRPSRVRARRIGLGAVMALAIVAGGLCAAPPAVGAGLADKPAVGAGLADKADPAVRAQLAATGRVTVWVLLRDDRAALRPAAAIRNWAQRGRFVVDALRDQATRGQAGLLDLLSRRGVDHRSFWAVNTVRATVDEAVLREIASRPEVVRIVPDGSEHIPDPLPAKAEPGVSSVEWNIDRIGAPRVWSTFGDRGGGIVVASVDTGVQFDHPALVRQYRGSHDGGFDHEYNWYDPSDICTSPASVPCDNVGHGTHTMGTMIGGAGDPNQIGVAPDARWISAKGCESTSCSFTALLAAGQWILAPTDLRGGNPRPDLRPNIVNNSWGGGGGNPWLQPLVDAWVAAGIFPAFANGNSGPGCATSGSPGDYANTYSAAAFDRDNAVAPFSSRGPSAFGGAVKPDIAAPGVDVRSSTPGNSYAAYSGTSMASPHVAGTVALMWSGAPALVGDVTATRAVLNATSIGVDDESCGGAAADNNVWGHGRLDAFAAVDQSPRAHTAVLTGTVTDAGTGQPLAGADIQVRGPVDRDGTTDATGGYRLVLPTGNYRVTVTAYGYGEQSAAVTVTEGETARHDFALRPAPRFRITGHVFDADNLPVANATVTVLGTPIPSATTDANGYYHIEGVPAGTYRVRAEAGGCFTAQTRSQFVDGDKALDFFLAPVGDGFGYSCRLEDPGFVEADTVLPLAGDDASLAVALPFPFRFYGRSHDTVNVSTNGYLTFGPFGTAFFNGPVPDTAPPNDAIYPFWDDLYVDSAASVRSRVVGAAPDRSFVIEWRDVAFFADFSRRVDVEVILHENGQIEFQYRNVTDDARGRGSSATIGIENPEGTKGLQYSFDQPVLGRPAFGIRFFFQRDAYAQIRAESYDAQSGVRLEPCSEGGQDITDLGNGDWARFDNVAFGRTPPRDLVARVASGAEGVSGVVEVRLDDVNAAPFGRFSVGYTGGWQSWTTLAGNVEPVTGTHTVYLHFTSDQPADFVSVEWFQFRR